MGQPFPGVWLPREMNIHAGITMAMGSLEAAYARRFSDYKEADVKTRIRIPKPAAPPAIEPAAFDDAGAGTSGPFVPDADPQQEVIAEVRVHGNAYLRDEEVIKLAGVAVGQPLAPDGIAAIERRLKASGHFDSVEVRKRYRSLDSSTDVALILLVNERAGFTSETVSERPATFGWARLKSKLMFLPILDYDDGYGFTYGGRVSTIGMLGMGERLSVPLTWGGTRRAAIEGDRHVQDRAAEPRRIDVRHLAEREPALRNRRSARRLDGPCRTKLRSGGPHRRLDVAEHCRLRRARRSAVDSRCRCRARHARRPRLSPQRRVPQRRLERTARATPGRPHQPVLQRCPRLSGRDRPGRAGRTRAVLVRGQDAPRLRAPAARRRQQPARLSAPALSTAIGCWRPPRSCACR